MVYPVSVIAESKMPVIVKPEFVIPSITYPDFDESMTYPEYDAPESVKKRCPEQQLEEKWEGFSGPQD